MNDIDEVEKQLYEELMTVILFLNANGMPLDQVKEMILWKVERAFMEYKENNIRDKFTNEDK